MKCSNAFTNLEVGIISILLNSECSLHIISISPFSDTPIANAFSHFVACMYIRLIILLNLLRLSFNETLFSFITHAFLHLIYEICQPQGCKDFHLLFPQEISITLPLQLGLYSMLCVNIVIWCETKARVYVCQIMSLRIRIVFDTITLKNFNFSACLGGSVG